MAEGLVSVAVMVCTTPVAFSASSRLASEVMTGAVASSTVMVNSCVSPNNSSISELSFNNKATS